MSPRHMRRPVLPAVPDMRFETAFIAKIQPHIHLTRATTKTTSREPSHDFDMVYDEKADKENTLVHHQEEELRIEWGSVLWATFRDQVLSTWLQGAAWTVISFYLMPVYGRLSEQVGQRFKHEEGGAVAYLRRWVQQLGLSTRGEY